MLSKLVRNHLMIYVSQIITLHTLNLYRAICQLNLNKMGRKKWTNIITENRLHLVVSNIS